MATKTKNNLHGDTGHSLELLRTEISKLNNELQALYGVDIKATVKPAVPQNRIPGRFKGRLAVGKQFFEPLTDAELKAFSAE